MPQGNLNIHEMDKKTPKIKWSKVREEIDDI